MFVCQKCGRVTGAKEKVGHLVVEKRSRTYPGGSEGWEIKREIVVCGSCLQGASENS